MCSFGAMVLAGRKEANLGTRGLANGLGRQVLYSLLSIHKARKRCDGTAVRSVRRHTDVTAIPDWGSTPNGNQQKDMRLLCMHSYGQLVPLTIARYATPHTLHVVNYGPSRERTTYCNALIGAKTVWFVSQGDDARNGRAPAMGLPTAANTRHEWTACITWARTVWKHFAVRVRMMIPSSMRNLYVSMQAQ